MVDEIHWILAPRLIGGDGRAALGSLGVLSLTDALDLDVAGVRRLGRDDPHSGPARSSGGTKQGKATVNVYSSDLDATGLRFAVVVARFNHLISAALLDACVDTLVARGADADAIDVAWVPGAFEIPQATRRLADSGRYAAIVTLGSVIRGGTPHFDYVCIG